MTTAAMGTEFDAKVPAALAASLLLHAGGLALWLHASKKNAETQASVITDVDILMAQPNAQAAPKPPPASMRDFLKMALPSIPKMRAPMSVAAPELKRDLMQIPQMKIEDKGRLKDPSKLAALDLGKRHMDLAKVEERLTESHAKPAMELPKLEEIGTRRAAPKVLQMAALEEESRSRMAPQGLSAMAPELGRRRAPSAAPLLPAEASAGRPSTLSKMADMLTSEAQPLKLQPKSIPTQRMESLASEQPAVAKKSVDLRQVKRKSVEIEGPLSNRRVRAYSVPQFPQWAKDQGIVEADVAIRFFVDPDGNVLEEEMRVERTSGFGRLDRLAQDHLKRWRFEPLTTGSGNQWGIITFRFVLE